MPECKCGRFFRSELALEQHQHDRARLSNTNPCTGAASPANQPKGRTGKNESQRNAWIRKDVKKDLLICSISHDTLAPASARVTSSGDTELVCSYNWRGKKYPGLYVPGYAPKWNKVDLPAEVAPDSGIYYIDQNAARSPEHSFWPMFEAAALMNADFRFDKIDVITNRNSLRKLLLFCSRKTQDPFRIELFLVKNTLVLGRCSASNTEKVKASDGKYGHSFEKKFTNVPPGADGLSGYYRALKYSIGDLSCVVRCEVDVCYEGEEEKTLTVDEENALNLSSLIVRLGDMQMSDRPKRGKPVVPQSTAAELKTTAKPKRASTFMAQLWFGRIPWLIVGQHNRGTFHSVQINHVQTGFADWENRQQDALQKMAGLLDRLRDAVREADGRNCILVCERGPGDDLKIYKSLVEKDVLPQQLLKRFWTMPKESKKLASA